MTNRPHGTLYVGATSDLVRRVWEHKNAVVRRFTRDYRLTTLVYLEEHATMPLALTRERTIKHWVRRWKLDLVERMNPRWDDLYIGIAKWP